MPFSGVNTANVPQMEDIKSWTKYHLGRRYQLLAFALDKQPQQGQCLSKYDMLHYKRIETRLCLTSYHVILYVIVKFFGIC